ncbi:MAG: hypothetical protein WC876_07910 [Candidatus Thermoplasmatota archaeon]|jgi:hypothetical protein
MRSVWRFLLAASIVAAGCTTPPDERSPSATSSGQGVAPGEQHPDDGTLGKPSHAENTAAGLHLVGDGSASSLTPPWESVTFWFNATNQGGEAIARGGCERPFGFVLRNSTGVSYEIYESGFRCLGFTEMPLRSQAIYAFNMSWSGRVAVGNSYQPAPAGAYTLTTSFTVWQGELNRTVAVTLPIDVVEPSPP